MTTQQTKLNDLQVAYFLLIEARVLFDKINSEYTKKVDKLLDSLESDMYGGKKDE